MNELNLYDDPELSALHGGPRIPTFDEWYAEYPKKQGKAAARKRWAKMSPAERASAFAALPGWWAYVEMCGTQYVPMASTWLNQSRWEDEAPIPPPPPRTTGPGMSAVRQGLARARAQRKELNP
jgi:hypothetical protein